MRVFSLNQFRSIASMAILAGALALVGDVGAVSAQSGASCTCQVSAGVSGVVQSVSGNVFVSQARGSSPAQVDMRLGAGDTVLVGPQSSSIVAFDGCQLNLRANTTFEVRPQGELLCLAVNGNGAEAGAVAQGGVISAPAKIAAGIGLGAVVLSVSDKEKTVSR